MKKNNTKVELKKYLSQKEKIKNTFISSCIILVVLTFFIFITYSYFIKDSGEIDVGNTYAAVPEYDVEIVNKELVDNTNGQQAIITIYNNSNTNTYSYNLGYYANTGGACNTINVYYKIPSYEYSHSEGIIKPNEEKKIYLVSNRICMGRDTLIGEYSPVELKLYSGYEYTPSLLEYPYEKIEYSTLSSTAELTDLTPSTGFLSPAYNENTDNYNLYVPYTYTDTTYNPDAHININPTFTNGGYITSETDYTNGTIYYSFYSYNSHTISVYAEDGTFVKAITINSGVAAVSNLKIESYSSSKSSVIYNSSLGYCGSIGGRFCSISGLDSNLNKTRFTFTFADENWNSGYDFGISLINRYNQFPRCSSNNSPNVINNTVMDFNTASIEVGENNYLYIYLCNGGKVDLMLAQYTLLFN